MVWSLLITFLLGLSSLGLRISEWLGVVWGGVLLSVVYPRSLSLISMYHALFTYTKRDCLLLYSCIMCFLYRLPLEMHGAFSLQATDESIPLLSEVYVWYLMDRVFQFYPSLHELKPFWLTFRFLSDVSLYFYYVSFLYFCTLRRIVRCVCSHHVLCVKLFIYIVWPPVGWLVLVWACINVNSLHNHLFHNSEIRNWIFIST